MNVKITYKEVEKPIDKVTLELTEKEAFVIKILAGSVVGGGALRTITDNIYHTLKGVKPCYDFDTSAFLKDAINLSVSSEAHLKKVFP
jgi:hypothetical protein